MTTRAYTIYRLLGHGGYGKVYQASAAEPDGKKRVVALKLVDPARVSEDNLAGLRDEARVAHLLDDPAVVHVEPPFLLEGRWAVEMEFADGASLYRVLEDHPRIPPRPAAELVAEVLRALDHLVHQPGPDGQPLGFVHRDIKPGNLQLVPTGEVKLLDFGCALVHGAARERPGTDSDAVVGTRGYIAPERFESLEDPKGDVYALGVLLHHLVTGTLPGSIAETLPLPPEADEVLRVAEAMRHREVTERMDAAQARRQLLAVHHRIPGPTLAEWTRVARPVPRGLPPDELVGRTLHVTQHEMPLYGERRKGKTVTPVALLQSDPVMSDSVVPIPERAQAPAPPAQAGPSWVVVAIVAVLATVVALGCGGGVGAVLGLLMW